MTSTIIILLSVLDILSDLVEFTYDLGVWTRKYLLPVVLFVIFAGYFYSNKVWDKLTGQSFKLNIRNTPMTTGFSYC
jgi:hypothetical protein